MSSGGSWVRGQGSGEENYSHAKGFTLLEVLMAMSILAVIVTVIYASFSTTGRNVEQAEARRDRTDLARTLIAKLSDDIANAYYNSSIKETVLEAQPSTTTEGEPRFDSLALTTLTNWRKPDSKEMDLWEVGYRFEDRLDGKGKVLIRREKRELNKDSTPLEGGTDYEVTDQITELRLRYFDGSTWVDEWHSSSKQKLPRAVEILLTQADGSSFLTSVEAGR
jgi:general secretion pathway protein J